MCEAGTRSYLPQVFTDEAYNLDYSLVSILSNGLFWNKELFALIAEHKEQTVVQIDLHGDNDDYINWFMGTQIPNITHRVKDTIMRINNSGILMRVVTMVTPQNIDQIENIAGWVKEAGIETYGISAITPMGRADCPDQSSQRPSRNCHRHDTIIIPGTDTALLTSTYTKNLICNSKSDQKPVSRGSTPFQLLGK